MSMLRQAPFRPNMYDMRPAATLVAPPVVHSGNLGSSKLLSWHLRTRLMLQL